MAKKVTRKKEKTSGQKETKRLESANSFLQKTPTWKFNRTDANHTRWNLHNNCQTQKLVEDLTNFERMTWDEIMVRAKKQNHHVDVASFTKEAKDRLQDLNIFEDQLFSLRLSGKTRIYGILQDGTFSILWYDCNHEIYPSKMKHT
ncbi:hypothetical protein IGK30_003240 [Enterococcus sp. AZ178]|uniref:hypothetical protein n=1 Tax=Enterococcus sp. AZ178 TaxID=2774822 RepID=UPI003F2423B8